MSQPIPGDVRSQPETPEDAAATEASVAEDVDTEPRLTNGQAYTIFMILFFFTVGIMSIIRPITTGSSRRPSKRPTPPRGVMSAFRPITGFRNGSFWMWPEAGRVL